jgi:hypothetical protein
LLTERNILEWAGIGFNEDETNRLMKSLKVGITILTKEFGQY